MIQRKQHDSIIESYERLLQKLKIDKKSTTSKISQIIGQSLYTFCSEHKNPAIWCLGRHTDMLMTDYISEMRKVKIIIDSSPNHSVRSGFKIITPDQIEKNMIDGIIISSYVYKDEIKEELSLSHKAVDYLDIYEKLDANGINLKASYFSESHPHSKYETINELQILYKNSLIKNDQIECLKKIIKQYILIKDFQTAIKYAEQLTRLTENISSRTLLDEIRNLYKLEKEQISKINSENVLMLCVDGLRRQDLIGGKMPKLLNWINKKAYFFDNAYSSSTSTYESLIPVYSSNHDMKTQYYDRNQISEKECAFIKEACKQNRNIFFYTDGAQYIDSKKIKFIGHSQTITEKIWDFMKDSIGESNGLFYLHILYESHYSYANPYTENSLIADGSNIMFDFLDSKGGKLRTDYVKQQNDALRYIDNILIPFLEQITCRIVLYADHGNILMKKTETLKQLDRLKYSCHKDLIEIPLAIKCPELQPQRNHHLISLMELNKIIISLLKKDGYNYCGQKYIKVQRSRIYNPDFQYLYKYYGKERELQAFELFIFNNGVQLIIYEDGEWKIISNELNLEIDAFSLYQSVLPDITVCKRNDLLLN